MADNGRPNKREDWTGVQTYLRPEHYKRLRAVADRDGTTIEHVARMAILAGLPTVERPPIGTGAGTGTGAT